MNIYIALPFIVVSNIIMGFVLGKFHERYEWNKLIKKNIIPKPF